MAWEGIGMGPRAGAGPGLDEEKWVVQQAFLLRSRLVSSAVSDSEAPLGSLRPRASGLTPLDL
jgi:hypothetical protein